MSKHDRRLRSLCPLAAGCLLAGLLLAGCNDTKEPTEPTRPSPGGDVTATPEDSNASAPPATDNGQTAAVPAPAERAPIALPRHWFETNISAWKGRRWTDLDLVRYLRETPDISDEGEFFLVYYSRTCAHCEEMFRNDFRRDAALAARIVAIEIPESTSVMTAPNAWAMPATEVRQFISLPMETNWIITAPLVVRIVDGVVQCAEESDHKTCMNL